MKGTIGNSCNFTNCKLNEYIFNGSPIVGSVVNCIFDIDDFIHKVNLWNTIYISQYSEPNIDFKNVNIPTDFAIYGQYDSDRTYSNFIGTSTTGHEFGDGMGNYTYTFKNVSIDKSGKAQFKLDIKDPAYAITGGTAIEFVTSGL
jgi:hypothetical protein